MTYLPKQLHALPFLVSTSAFPNDRPPQACCHLCLGVERDIGLSVLLQFLPFGVTMNPRAGLPGDGVTGVYCEPGFRPWDSWPGSMQRCWEARDVYFQAAMRAASCGEGWHPWKSEATQPGAFQM